MTAQQILQEIISIITGGISGVATGIGQGLSTLASNIFLTGTGENQTISTFGILVLVFAGVALALGLCRLVVKFITGFGNSSRM